MKVIYTLFIYLLISYSGFSQKRKTDSLEKIISTTSQDTTKGKTLSELCRVYIKNGDSALFMKNYNQLGEIAIRTKNPAMGNLYYIVRAVFEEKVRSNMDTALAYYIRSYECCKKANNKPLIAKRTNYIATILLNKAKYKEAVAYYYESIKICEELGNKTEESYAYYGLGEAMNLQQNYKKALEVYYRAFALAQETQDPAALSAGYNNIGMIYNTTGKRDSALHYYNLALEFNTKRNNEPGIASTLGRISALLMHNKEFEKASELLKRALAINLKYDNKELLAATYINLSEANYSLNKDKDAEVYAENALTIAKEKGLSQYEEYCYKLLGSIYQSEGKYLQSSQVLLRYVNLHDSLVNLENNRLTSELEEKYQGEKKKKEIELLNKDKALKETDIKKQKQFSFFIALVAILAGITGFVIFLGLRRKQKDNKILSEKNTIIHQQKEIVEEKNKEITDSINYAKRIQFALLANKELMAANLSPHFIFFNPKDIVSGDFYWAALHENKFYLAICDSTGHGVPGAFMSLLNMGFLSEAINEKNINQPHKIFNYVRQRLVNSISKEGQKDGFDGILLSIDLATKQLSYAAAYNAPVLVSNGVLQNLPANKMPVGYGEKEDSFEIFTVDTKPGDMLYLFTDGYADQFGGPKGKKFLSKQLNNLLQEISALPLDIQKEKIVTAFNTWKGNVEQVDDICLMGIKF